MVMEPMQGKLASSQIDFGYTDQFCIPAVTSVFFWSCDNVVGDSLEFNQQIEAPYVFDWDNAIALDTMQGNRASSRREGKKYNLAGEYHPQETVDSQDTFSSN